MTNRNGQLWVNAGVAALVVVLTAFAYNALAGDGDKDGADAPEISLRPATGEHALGTTVVSDPAPPGRSSCLDPALSEEAITRLVQRILAVDSKFGGPIAVGREEAEELVNFDVLFPATPDGWTSETSFRVYNYHPGNVMRQCVVSTTIVDPGVVDYLTFPGSTIINEAGETVVREDSSYEIKKEASVHVQRLSQQRELKRDTPRNKTREVTVQGQLAFLYERFDDPAIFIYWHQGPLDIRVNCSLIVTVDECLAIAESIE